MVCGACFQIKIVLALSGEILITKSIALRDLLYPEATLSYLHPISSHAFTLPLSCLRPVEFLRVRSATGRAGYRASIIDPWRFGTTWVVVW
jgi:hypothetical protein